MTQGEREELLSCLEVLSSIYEDLNQKVIALENVLPPEHRQQYDAERNKLRDRGGLTNAATALEALRRKLLL